MQEISHESLSFDTALQEFPQGEYRDALIHVNNTVDMAKRMLLQNRVKQFSASDVVQLVRIILDCEARG